MLHRMFGGLLKSSCDFWPRNSNIHRSTQKSTMRPGTVWQARVNKAWRFYFTITDDIYRIEDVTPHPK